MQREYETLAEFPRGPFLIIVDKTREDLSPRDCFDTGDEDEICRKINDGTFDWFMLRVRAFFDGHELGSSYLGGCCYEDAREVLTDGTAEEFVEQAIKEARAAVGSLKEKLDQLEI